MMVDMQLIVDYSKYMEVIVMALGLGLAGSDIFGVVVIMAALSAGATKRSIAVFALTVLLGTITLATSMSLIFGPSVEYVATFINGLPSLVWVGIEAVLVVLLFFWATKRIIRDSTKQKKEHHSTKWLKYGLFMVGLAFVLSTLADPSYLALIALAGHNGNFFVVLSAHTIWILISQFTLFAVAIAVMFNKHKPLLKWIQKVQKKYAKQLSIILTAIIVLMSLAILADLVTFLASGRWLY